VIRCPSQNTYVAGSTPRRSSPDRIANYTRALMSAWRL
jgi:hypothetical protein